MPHRGVLAERRDPRVVRPCIPLFVSRSRTARPIWFVTRASFSRLLAKLDKRARAFVQAAGFEPRPGRHLLLPSASGTGGVLFGLEDAKADNNPFLPGLLPGVLPAGTYRFANAPHDARLAALAFALGSYRFSRYRKATDKAVRLVLPDGVDGGELSRIAEGVTLARDLINTPANDMGPAELEAAARALAKRHGAKVRSIVGDDAQEAELSADPCRRPRGRRRARAAADRPALGQGRATRR